MIQVEGLTKKYGDRKAIDSLSFTINKGEVVGFLGPNGAGKSTTMKIITGFMSPTEGSVEVAGFDVFEQPIEVKKRIGYLPETPPVYGDMRVEEYLKFVARLKGCEEAKINELVDQAIEKTNLQEVRSRLIQNLSKGFQQRVGISQALVSNPEILILDEPTVGLDPKQVAEIRKLISSLKGQHTIILSTHILPEVQASCERIIIINEGHIVAEDSLEGLSRKISGESRVDLEVLRNHDEVEKSLMEVSGVFKAESNNKVLQVTYDGNASTLEQVAAHTVEKGAGLIAMNSKSIGLEDIFIRLTSSDNMQEGQQ